MGSYFTDFFKKNGFEVIVSDKNTKLSNKQLAKKADVVIVSVPIDETEEVIEEVASLVKRSGLLMDFTSVKVMPMDAMKQANSGYLGCHPLFGPTTGIANQIMILTPGKGKLWHAWAKNLFEKNKAIVREISPKKHDEMMAYIQTLNHFARITLADTLRKSGIKIDEFLKYPSSVYMMELYMMGRVLNQNPHLYANIQMNNPHNIKTIQSYLQSCRTLAETIEKKSFRQNKEFFRRNTQYLGDFTRLAMDESDRLLKQLRLPEKSRLFKLGPKPTRNDTALLGPENTYSDMALRRSKKKVMPWYASSIPEIVELVVKGKVREGLVPIENSSSGSIRETLDELYEENVIIDDMIELPIKLSLASTIKMPLRKVKTVYSHSQALLQCRKFIKKHLGSATLVPMPSTTAALERVLLEDKEGTVAIASPAATEAYNLKLIQDFIEDEKDNTTYFALIKKGRKFKKKAKAKRTSIAFHFKKDSPGSLNNILNFFANAGINLSKIESRPSSRVKGQYVFYIDFLKAYHDQDTKKVLSKIEDLVANLKVLGSY